MVSLKNHRREGSRSSCKNGGSPYRWRGAGGAGGGLGKVEGESTDFYEKYMDFVAAMLFTQQVFHLEWLFLFWYFLIYIYLIFYYFGWSLSLVLLTKVFFLKKKHVTLFFSVLKMKKWLCHISLFFCLSSISLGWYC